MKLNFFRNIDAFILKKLRHIKSNLLSKILSKSGSFIFTFILIVGFFFLPIDDVRAVAATCLCAIVLDTLILLVLKYSVRRRRPVEPKGLRYRYDPYSFPSGHASRLSSLCAVCYCLPIVMSVLIVLCLTCTFCRMVEKRHYFTDCIVGILVGILCGIFVTWAAAKSIIPIHYILYLFGLL